MKKIIKISKWAAISLLAAFVVLVIARIPFYNQNKKTEAQVAKIHATKLTMDDVTGANLPPDPGAEADKTVAGVDANNNGIRDDVELAIFKEYPNSAKTRAVLLQYALALQMEATQPFLEKGNVTAVIGKESSADVCISDTLVPRESPESWRTAEDVQKIENYVSFVENEQLNTASRKNNQNDFYKKSGSYEVLRENVCDINIASLLN